jgi:hypothetical protein
VDARSAVPALVCVLLLSACERHVTEVRTRCEGPNMVYETWKLDPGDDQPHLELVDMQIAPGDPRCA